MKFSLPMLIASSFLSLNLNADFKTQTGVDGFNIRMTEAKQILGFCQQYTNEFATMVRSCSKYSDRAVAGLTTVTNDICISLQTKMTAFENFLESNLCNGRSPQVFNNLLQNLNDLKSSVDQTVLKITDYRNSLMNLENVPFTGQLSREILIVWAMEVTNNYKMCPVQTLGESDLKFFGQSNDATKIYFRWKQALMGSNRLENGVLARESTAKTKTERDRITEFKPMLNGAGLALELGPNGLRTTNNRVSWMQWLNSRTSDQLNQGRSALSLAAQNSWIQQMNRRSLNEVTRQISAEIFGLMDLARARNNEVLNLCRAQQTNDEYYDEGEADDGYWY